MWFYYWLGQETFEAYKAICTNLRLRYRLINPYRITNLEKEDYWFFPWPEDIVPIAVWMIFAAVLFFWIYKRVNTSSIYAFLSLGLGGLALSLLFGFQTAYPRPVFLLTAVLSLSLFYGALSGFLTLLAVDKLPYFNVPDKFLLDTKTGFPQKRISYIIGAVLVLATWIFSSTLGQFFMATLLHDSTVLWECLGAMVVFVGVFGNACIPFVTLYDRPLLGGGYAVIIEPLFKKNGPAGRLELIVSVVVACVLYALATVFVKGGIDGSDFIGMFLLFGIGLGLVHSELTRTSQQAVVNVKRSRGIWN